MASYTPVKKGTDPSLQTGMPAPARRLDGHDVGSDGVQQALDRTAPIVEAFIAAQRQNVANSVTQIHRATLDHPEVSVSYQNHYGSETVTLSPTPTTGANAQTAEIVEDQPNDLIELAQQEVVTPATPLYLMVLYKTDLIAAIPMTGLKDPSPDYTATCPKTAWVSNEGERVVTMQALVDKLQYLLLPLDLTGQVAAATYYLSTNALGDAVATLAPPSAMPAMNGGQGVLYTMGGAYSYDAQRGFDQTAKPFMEAGEARCPYAIASDGTSYYLAQMAAMSDITIDPATVATVAQSTLLQGLIYQAQSEVQPDTVDAFSVSLVQDYKTTDIISGPLGHIDDPEVLTYQTDTYIFTVGPYPVGGGVVGSGYYAAGSFGQPFTIRDYKAAVSGVASTSLTPSGMEIVSTNAGPTDTSTSFPLMNANAKGELEVVMVPAQGSVEVQATEEFDTTKDKLSPVAGLSYEIKYGMSSGGDPSSAGFSYGTYSRSITYAGSPPAGTPSEALADQYLQQSLAQQKSQDKVSGPTKVVSAKITATYKFGADPQVDAPLETVPKGEPASNYNTITVGYSTDGGEAKIITGAASLMLPTYYPTTGSTTRSSQAGVFGETMTSESAGGSSNITIPGFPPMWEGKPYYTRNDEDASKVVTPYDTYAASSFAPWLHVSNGSHTIQGFAVDGEPHAFLDGDIEDWLPKLAKALKCAETEIVTMVMDVTAAKVKAVAHVKPTSYTSSGGGVPTGGLGTG